MVKFSPLHSTLYTLHFTYTQSTSPEVLCVFPLPINFNLPVNRQEIVYHSYFITYFSATPPLSITVDIRLIYGTYTVDTR